MWQDWGMEHGDAFGEALLDHFAGGDGAYLIERDDGLMEHLRSVEAYFLGVDAFAEIEAGGMEFVYGRVLDIGAGAGRFALAAVERGCDVVALDNSAGAVAVCRERGLVDVVHSSIHRYESDVRFDTFLMMGANLGLLAPDPVRTLVRLRAMANDGAQIVGSTLDPYVTEDPVHLAYHDANRDRGRLPGHVVIRIRRRVTIGAWFDYLFTSPDELTAIAERAGWSMNVVGHDGLRYVARLVAL
jgi:SAM-dependent methyltransferase